MCWGGRGEPPCASPTGRYFSLDCELDQRLRQEEPDPTADPDLDVPRSRSDYDDDEASNESDEFFDDDEVGDERSGRLLAEDEGYGPDLEKDEVAEDVGIDGGAASAEEAAARIVEP